MLMEILSQCKKPITTWLVYKELKPNFDGTLNKFKVRLVAKDLHQFLMQMEYHSCSSCTNNT
jgi:hypothetical protein